MPNTRDRIRKDQISILMTTRNASNKRSRCSSYVTIRVIKHFNLGMEFRGRHKRSSSRGSVPQDDLSLLSFSNHRVISALYSIAQVRLFTPRILLATFHLISGYYVKNKLNTLDDLRGVVEEQKGQVAMRKTSSLHQLNRQASVRSLAKHTENIDSLRVAR